MRVFLYLLALSALVGVAAADVNVTGKWSGSFKITHPNGEVEDSTAFLVLNQSGAEITGSVGPDQDKQMPIQKGKIDGDKITLEADNDGRTIRFVLTLSADTITGEATMTEDGGGTGKARLDVKRVK